MTQTYLRELTYSALITGVPCDAVPDWDDRPEGQSALRLAGPFRSGVRGTCVALSGCETPPFRVAAGDRLGCFFLSRRTFRSGGRTAESGGRRFKSDRWLCCFCAAARFSSGHLSQRRLVWHRHGLIALRGASLRKAAAAGPSGVPKHRTIRRSRVLRGPASRAVIATFHS